MLNPILWNADAGRSYRPRAPPVSRFSLRTKKPRDRGRQTACRSPGGKEPNTVPTNSFFVLNNQVKSQRQLGQPQEVFSKMARNRKQRRQQHGSAWHWKQTNSWYYTPPGTRKRVPLFDEDGERIRGKDNKEAAQLALARIKLSDELAPVSSPVSKEWTVAQVCEIYLADLTNTASSRQDAATLCFKPAAQFHFPLNQHTGTETPQCR